ncbi:MAG: hypothetical protein ACREDO_05295 [Methyloceanibacter sp.]
MLPSRRPLFLVLIAVLVIAVAVLAIIGVAYYRDKQADAERDADIKTIVKLSAIPVGATPQAVFDKVRAFVTTNSIHEIDAEFRKLRGERGFAKALIARAEGKRAEPVHMECSTRSNVMGTALRKLGYTTRTVALFDADSPKSHSFLDVLNPVTGKWESQDPDYDFYWVDHDGKRVSVFEVAENPDAFKPCQGDVCGWELEAVHGAKAVRIRELLEILTVTDKERGYRIARYTSRAGADKAKQFCETHDKWCKDGLEAAPR